MPPKTLTAEQVAEIDRQQQPQRPVNWQSVIPQKEDVLTYRVGREAALKDKPTMLTAEEVDAAEAQNSVAAETSFGRAMGMRPDRAAGPQAPGPKKVLSKSEVEQADHERVSNIAYFPTMDEWRRDEQYRAKRDDKVGKFIEAGKAIGGGIIQMAAATAYAPFDFVVRGTRAYDEWVNSTAEGVRQAGIGTAELWSWAGDVYEDNQKELQRLRVLNDQVRQRLAAENRFTGNLQQDEAILEEAIKQAKAQGLYEKTPEDLSEDEATRFQRFIRDRSFQQQAANITETNIGTLPDGRAEMGIDESKLNPGLVLGSSFVFDPLNVPIPLGLGAVNKVRLLRRVGSLTGKPLKLGSRVAGGAAQKAEDLYSGIVEGVERATGIGEAGQAAAASAVSWKAAAAMATLKGSGRVLRNVERGLETGSILAREIGIGGVGVARVEAASKLRGAAIPERYRRAYDGFFTGADSTLRRVSETPGLSPIARRSAATLDKLGATQVFRAADDAVSGAVATAPIALPLAVIAPEERQPEILGAIATLGAGAGLVGGKVRRVTEFEDALVAKMLADAEISGGDATAMANMFTHDKLVDMARMQSVVSAKADFIPLRATDYELNRTVQESMGLGTRGMYVDAQKGQRPRIFLNLDKMATGDIAGHEIGHAILKSNILGGEIKQGMRAMADQQYGTDGVAARGREYVTAMLTQEVRDGTTGIQLNALKPDEVTRIAAVGGDEAAEQALKNEFIRERWANDAEWRKSAIVERTDLLNQERLAQGENAWDWARDEIAAETFSGLGKGLNLSGIRASGPLGRAVGAASAAFEAMGARMKGNGRLETPNQLFVENPLFNTPEMRKAANNYVKTFDRYLVGLEKEGKIKQRGTPIAPTGKASDAARSPHTRTYANTKNGVTVIESDLFIERPDGTRVPKSQQMIDTQEKARAATLKSINDRTKFAEREGDWGARKVGNRVEVGGPTLPLQFDNFIQVPQWLRAKAREFEAGRAEGRSYLYSYNAIGTGESGSYKVKNLGNVEAKTGEMVPFGWAVSQKNHLLAKVIDLNSFRAAAIRAIDNEQLGEFGNDLRAVEAGLKQMLRNYQDGNPGETGLGVTRKNILNGLLGTGTVTQRQNNPAWYTLNNQGSVRSFRFDRLNYADPYGTGYFPHYNKININALPDDAGRMSMDSYRQFDADRKAAWMNREAVKRGYSNATNWQNADPQGFQAADGQYRQEFPTESMPQQIPREAQGMPDAVQGMTTDQLLRQYEENQGYLGLSTLGMREGRPVRGGAAQTRELLRRNEAISAELERRGVRQEDPQLQRALQRRGQAMPDAAPADAPPFYMKSTRVLDAKIQGKAATVDQVRAILTNPQNGIKAEELKWTGVLQAAERLAKENNGKVPKEALLQYLADDGAVRLEEVRMRDVSEIDVPAQWEQQRQEEILRARAEEYARQQDRSADDVYDEIIRDAAELSETMNEARIEWLDSVKEPPTKFGQYQLPGGENYREVVLAMPVKTNGDPIRSFTKNADGWFNVVFRDGEQGTYRTLDDARADGVGNADIRGVDEYRSKHFDTPNYVAHMRLNERTDAAGKPGLFLEEVQSDRHQAGREKGYSGEFDEARRNELRAKSTPLTDAEMAELGELNSQALGRSGIPDAPFRKDWPLQMFKRALADAVSSGKEWIGWTTGETQAARYDLSKQINMVSAMKLMDGGYVVYMEGKDGGHLFRNQHGFSENGIRRFTPDELKEFIGKEAAENVLRGADNVKPDKNGSRDWYDSKPADLKVGGEGMKGFYDQILPKEISKYVKQWGGQVEKARIGTKSSKRVDDLSDMELVQELERTSDTTPIWRVNITPQMREGIKKAGQALFVGGVAAVVAEEEL